MPDDEAQGLGIVADDLTGAMDSSGHFPQKGLSTVVLLDLNCSLAADVLVISTDSRADDANTARKKVTEAIKRLAGRLVYKKVDSTLRGNIGVELETAMEELACDKAIVAPAFPAVGRTTVDGVLLVDGVGVAQTQFAHDPVSPVTGSHIPTMLEESMGRRVGCLSVEYTGAGPEALSHKISEMPEAVIVCDITAQSQLENIVRAAALTKDRCLLCGSGGMARELHLLLGERHRGRLATARNSPHGPALVVVGSRNPVAAGQLQKAKGELGLPILDLKVEDLNGHNRSSEEVGRIVEEASRFLAQGRTLALTSTFSRYVPALKHAVAPAMAEAVANILAAEKFAGLFLCGGDIAIQVCRRLSVSAIRIHGEVEPGVPAGEIVGGQAQGLRVVTKAGGFGTDATLMNSISYVEKGRLS